MIRKRKRNLGLQIARWSLAGDSGEICFGAESVARRLESGILGYTPESRNQEYCETKEHMNHMYLCLDDNLVRNNQDIRDDIYDID